MPNFDPEREMVEFDRVLDGIPGSRGWPLPTTRDDVRKLAEMLVYSYRFTCIDAESVIASAYYAIVGGNP